MVLALINNPKIMWVASIPISAYLMLTPTLHPWYVLLIIPFLPFILAPDSSSSQKLFAFSWIILSITVNFSYLTYINESDFREYKLVRFLEYAPFYFLIFSAILMKVINFSGVKTQVDICALISLLGPLSQPAPPTGADAQSMLSMKLSGLSNMPP